MRSPLLLFVLLALPALCLAMPAAWGDQLKFMGDSLQCMDYAHNGTVSLQVGSLSRFATSMFIISGDRVVDSCNVNDLFGISVEWHGAHGGHLFVAYDEFLARFVVASPMVGLPPLEDYEPPPVEFVLSALTPPKSCGEFLFQDVLEHGQDWHTVAQAAINAGWGKELLFIARR